MYVCMYVCVIYHSEIDTLVRPDIATTGLSEMDLNRRRTRVHWVNVPRSGKSDLDAVNAVLSATFEKEVRGPNMIARGTLTDDGLSL